MPIALFTRLRGRGVLRSSWLQSPPATPRPGRIEPDLAPSRPDLSPAVDTFVAKIRYEPLRPHPPIKSQARIMAPPQAWPIGPGRSNGL
jgi:hypothetical protein